MRKTTRYITLCLMSLLAFAGCDVHEFPEESGYGPTPFLLHLDFNTEMPLHKEVAYTRSKADNSDPHDIRYVIGIYRNGESEVADTTVVFTKSDISDLNYTAKLNLYEGDYTFRVWADYVDTGETSDKYYNTEDFTKIILADQNNHSGSNDYRDAFRGTATATVLNPSYYTGIAASSIKNEATVEMIRPMGKFKFISTDVEVFLNRVSQMLQSRGVGKIDYVSLDSKAAYEQLWQTLKIDDFKVVFRYNPYMHNSFNIFTDKPAGSWTGISFTSQMQSDSKEEITLGYDYVFVNGTETTLGISVEVYNDEGVLMSSTRTINVPVLRSKLTIVKGEFLTSKASGGITIDPGYDGEDFNIEIK